MRRFLAWLVLTAVVAVVELFVFSTAVSAFVVLFLTLAGREAWQSGKDWMDERKYSIGGDYETIVSGSTSLQGETVDADQKIRRDLHLQQIGKRIIGTETPKPASGSTTLWEITGQIFVGGVIVGIWAKKHPPGNPSRGAFYMETFPLDTRQFKGLWVGWDAGAKQTTNGEWDWIRK